jgi:HK97 family phage prohead protease
MATTERPKVGQVEERQAPLEADGQKIRGVIPYNTASADLGGFTEVIERGALDRAKLDDLVCVVDHVGVPIGRHPTTLEVEDRDDGLHWAVDPPKSREDIREAVERGDLCGGSWRMVVGKDEWRGDVRHVIEIKQLKDVSVVTRPAYRDAVVELRSAEQANNEATSQEQDQVEEQVNNEVRSEEPTEVARPAGSLRVEERAELTPFQSLAQVFESRGFPTSPASVTWDEFRTLTWSGGTVLTDLNPTRREGVALGYDQRFVYPAFPSVGVDSATTSVQVLRQASRTLPAGTAIVRPIDSVTQKPEVATATELVSQQLSQVAAVETDIPNILLEQNQFERMVEVDLNLAISEGLDRLVVNGLATAGTAATVTGDVLQKTRRAITVVQSVGYSPDTLVIDPAGAEALDLLRSSGSEQFYLWGPGQGAPGGPFGLQLRVAKAAGTAIADSRAFGQLYSSPLRLQRFEQDAGATNQSTVRLEGHATFAVERVTAGLRIV